MQIRLEISSLALSSSDFLGAPPVSAITFLRFQFNINFNAMLIVVFNKEVLGFFFFKCPGAAAPAQESWSAHLL